MRCLLVCAAVISTLHAGTAPDSATIRRALEARYQNVRTLKADFFERYTDGSGTVTAESGTVYFARPGRMRWDYESPEQKLFLVDGTNVWFYVPADHAASRAKLKESSDWRTPLALLVGKADLSKVCRTIEIVNPASGQSGDSATQRLNALVRLLSVHPGDTVLRCIPRYRSDAVGDGGREILLETDTKVNLIGVVIQEPGNTTTEFRFGSWQENIPISEATFHFHTPPGVSIVDEDSIAEEIH